MALGLSFAASGMGAGVANQFLFIENAVIGFSQPQNIEAARVLAAGWINDMFAGTHNGIYAAPGAVLPIETSTGTATAYALPDSHHQV
jgi:hypothetical protein